MNDLNKKRSSRIEWPILFQKLGKDQKKKQKKRSSRVEGPIFYQKLGEDQKKRKGLDGTNIAIGGEPRPPAPPGYAYVTIF